MERLKTLEEMPGALSYLIEKVEGLEKAAQSLLNRQEESSSPHWMDVDELCNYIPPCQTNGLWLGVWQADTAPQDKQSTGFPPVRDWRLDETLWQ